jgi:RNA polymerase sigma-70 factor (ECF subfamily)
MRKSVQPGPLPDADAPVRNESDADEDPANAHHRSRAVEEGADGRPRLFSDPDPVHLGPDPEANLNDALLVERARQKDHAAFAVLVRRYERKLIRVLFRMVRDPEQARDLAQETFWRVYNRLDRFDTARRFGPWLFRVGVNLALDDLRRTRSEPNPPASIDRPRGDGQLPYELPDPDPRIQSETAQEVQFVLAQLPISYRTILVLRDLEGFSSSEVAAIVGRREATIRWRLAKAREKFREIWERRQETVRRGAMDG